jgi:hypothetical protein
MAPHVAAPTIAAVSLLMTPVQLDRKSPSALRAKYLLVCISTPLNLLRISAKVVQAEYLCQEKKLEKASQFLLV